MKYTSKYILIYIFYFIIILSFFAKLGIADPDVVTEGSSNWNFWILGDRKVDINGSSNITVDEKNSDLIKLNFGIKVNQSNNFYISDESNLNLVGILYLYKDIDQTTSIQFGFLNNDNNRYSILQNRGYVNLLPNSTIYFKNRLSNIILFNNSYISEFNSLEIRYNKSFLMNTLNISSEYSPNIKLSLTPKNNLFYLANGALGLMDLNINYYNEYNDIGYGLLFSGRSYVSNITPKGYEILFAPNIDYLGLGLNFSLLNGYLKKDNLDLKYTSADVILNYSILSLQTALDYNYNVVRSVNSYISNIISFIVSYKVSNNLNLNMVLFNSNLKNLSKSDGVYFGFSLNL